MQLISNKDFEKHKFTVSELKNIEFDSCRFISCDFSELSLYNTEFVECVFDACNLSSIIIDEVSFKDVEFINSKLIGIDFSVCNNFMLSFSFDNCTLDYSLFYKLKIKNTKYLDCSIREVDFSECDLQSSSFSNCNLDRSVFNQTNLEKVDFRTAVNFIINPESNMMKKSKFSILGANTLLDSFKIIIE